MNRYWAACLVVLAGVVGVLPRVHAQPSPQAGTVRVIEGRLHSESVPAALAWKHFFSAMVMVGFDTPYDVEPRPEIIEPLSKYNLLIPEAQVRTVLLLSKATMDKVDALKRPLDPKGDGHNQLGLTKEQRASVMPNVFAAILAGRDALVEQLPETDMVAINRYVVTKIVPGIKTSVVQQ